MRVMFIGAVVCLACLSQAVAWNEKGHMVVADIAWRKLNPGQREVATKILKAHPHYAEFLASDRPATIDEAEWVFMRAAFWPDWIRSNHTAEYSKPTWHYITQGFVPPYSKLSPNDLPSESPNIVTQITASMEMVKRRTPEEKAVGLCWLLHLVGDIHQPLHCCSLLSEAFPKGDLGGNLALVRIDGGKPTKLHPTWDSLLGKSISPSSIISAVEEVEGIQVTGFNLATEPAEWAKEGFELAKTNAYLNGDLRPANADDKPADDAVPNVAEQYAKQAGAVARNQVAKAGQRLAVAVGSVLK